MIPKFRFKQKVLIKKGFYGGLIGRIKSYEETKPDLKNNIPSKIMYEIEVEEKETGIIKTYKEPQENLRSAWF